MDQLLYGIILVFSLLGLGFADYRHRLVFFYQPKTALRLYLLFLGFFLLWDVAGIVSGVFATNPVYVSGVYFFSPDMPLEELLFLSLFFYNTAIAWRLVWRHIS